MSVSSRLDPQAARDFLARYGVPVAQGYGIIEVGLPIMNIEEAAEHPEAIGRPVPGFEAAILDDALRPVSDGETGQLALRGPGMFAGYLSPPKRRDEVLREGWFMSGDLAHRDVAGRIVLDGRTSSVIHIAGHKVFPEEVAAVLDQHPAVLRSRVTSRPHLNWAKPSMPKFNCAAPAPPRRGRYSPVLPPPALQHKVPASLDLVSVLDPDPQRKGAPRMRILLVKPKPRLKTILKLHRSSCSSRWSSATWLPPYRRGMKCACWICASRGGPAVSSRARCKTTSRILLAYRVIRRVHQGQGARAGGAAVAAPDPHRRRWPSRYGLPEDYNLDCFDAIVRGEGCAPFRAIVEAAAGGRDFSGIENVMVPGPGFSAEEAARFPRYPDLATLPLPRRDLWDPRPVPVHLARGTTPAR